MVLTAHEDPVPWTELVGYFIYKICWPIPFLVRLMVQVTINKFIWELLFITV